jgi:hypothetical protein
LQGLGVFGATGFAQLPQGPAGDEDAGGGGGGDGGERAERGVYDLLIGLRGARDHGARQIGGKTFRKPLGSQQVEVAAGHVDHARAGFERGQCLAVVRLGVMAGGEDDMRGPLAICERAAESRGRSKGSRDAGTIS